MIGGMRAFARSKWALGLFALLIVSFGIFGLRDNFSGVTGGALSEVGDHAIHARDLSTAVDKEIERMRVEDNDVITPAQAVQRGVTQQQLLQLEYRNILLAYADKIGVQASDEAVNTRLLKESGVLKDSFGKITMEALQRLAAREKMSVREFEQYVKDSLTAGYIEDAVFNGLKTPDILAAPMIKFQGEQRTFSIAKLDNAAVPKPKEPTDAEMQAWYTSHKELFEVKERRRISVLTYSPQDFLDKVEYTEDQLKAEYQKRIKDYSTPETREITEFTSTDRNAIQKLVDLLKQAVKPEDALKQVPGVTRKDRSVKPADVQPEGYSQRLFATPLNDTLGPLQLDEGSPFMAVTVKSITPGIAKPYAEVAEKVRLDVAMPDAERLYDKNRDDFEEAAGGQSLEQIGKQFGFPVIQLEPVDASATTLKGDQAQLLATNRQAMQQLFSMSVGQMTDLFDGDKVRAMYRLDEIVPPFTRKFEDVKASVKLRMMAEQVIEIANKAADTAVADVKAGKAFPAAAAANKMVALPPLTTTRDGSSVIDPAALQAAFNLKAGDVAVVRARDNAPIVVRVDKIDAATPEAQAALKAKLGADVQRLLTGDISEVFQRGLRDEVPVKRDDVAVNKYFESFTKTDDQQ